MDESESLDKPVENRWPKVVTNKWNWLLYAALLVLFMAVGLLRRSEQHQQVDTSQNTKCIISADNLCVGKQVELTGVITSPELVSGQGYPFEAEDLAINNPIFVQDLIFSGKKAGGFGVSEEVPHQIPFGSQIHVRGSVVMQDEGRCTQPDYAQANPTICRPGGFRVKVTPDAIFSKQKDGEQGYFSMYGKVDMDVAPDNCAKAVRICEGVSGEGVCHEVVANEAWCEVLNSEHNSWLVMGVYGGHENSLRVQEAYAVHGVGYQNLPREQRGQGVDGIVDAVFNDQNPGVINVYNSLGEEVVHVDTGEDFYYDLSNVVVRDGEVWYMVGSVLYKINFGSNTPERVGVLDPRYFNGDVFSYWQSDEGNQVLWMDVNRVTERMIGSNVIGTERVYIGRLDLDEVEVVDDVVQMELVYEDTFEGYPHIMGYDRESGRLLLQRSVGESQATACYEKEIHEVDLTTGEKHLITRFIDQGNKYCQEVVHRVLQSDLAGQWFVVGWDFSKVVEGNQVSKLAIWERSPNGWEKQELVADRGLLNSRAVKFVDVRTDEIELVRSDTWEIEWLLDRSVGIFDTEYMSPAQEQERELDELYGQYHDLMMNRNVDYIGETEDSWLFWDESRADTAYYMLRKDSREVFVLGRFSAMALNKQVGGTVWVVD